jgi:hypothetical protein
MNTTTDPCFSITNNAAAGSAITRTFSEPGADHPERVDRCSQVDDLLGCPTHQVAPVRGRTPPPGLPFAATPVIVACWYFQLHVRCGSSAIEARRRGRLSSAWEHSRFGRVVRRCVRDSSTLADRCRHRSPAERSTEQKRPTTRQWGARASIPRRREHRVTRPPIRRESCDRSLAPA